MKKGFGGIVPVPRDGILANFLEYEGRGVGFCQ
jgi:hypothetical protein